METAFRHHVVKITLEGEQELGMFYVNVPFGENAQREFKRMVRAYAVGTLLRVTDDTLAGFHFSLQDGTVYELR